MWKASLLCKSLYRDLDEAYQECCVHSVFDHAVNLILSGEMVTLLSSGRFLYPYSFILREPSVLDKALFRPQMRAYISRHGFKVPDASIMVGFDGAELLDLSILSNGPYIIPEYLDMRLEYLISFLAKSKPGGICSLATDAEPNLYAEAVRPHIFRLLRAFFEGDDESAERISACMAGYGLGLTPSSDDFLAGFLAAYAVMSAVIMKNTGNTLEVIRRAGYAAASRTVDISAAFLRQIGKGMASVAVLELLRAFFSNAPYDVLFSSVKRVMSIGATSGSDMLTGIVICIRYFLKYENKEEYNHEPGSYAKH